VDDITFDEGTSGPVGESDSAGAEEVQESVEEEGLASPFLAKIPAQDRAVVARYIKDWDAGVTKKFQGIHSKYKPYEALGTVEELQRYQTLYNNLRTNPQQAFRLMFEGFQQQYGDKFEAMLPQILGLEEAMTDYQEDGEQYYAGSDDEDPDAIFQQNVMTELEELRAWREEQEEAAATYEEEQQLNGVMQALHRQYGDFDDEGVLVRIAAHGDPHKAVQEWRSTVARYSQNGAQRQAPKVMGGQGGVPSEQVDTKALRGADRRMAVQNALAALDNQ